MILLREGPIVAIVASIFVLGCVFGGINKNDFIEDKWRTYFNSTDVNKDGEVTKDDIGKLADNMIKIATYSKEEQQQLRDNVISVVSEIIGLDKSDGKPITVHDFIKTGKERMKDPPAYSGAFLKMGYIYFAMLNSDDDPSGLTVEEFTHFYEYRHLDLSLVPKAFGAIDVDGDGAISPDEFANAVVDFFFGTDVTGPGTYLIGAPKGL